MAFRDRCTGAAELIAADRVSKQLPSTIATLQFFIMLTAGFWKTLAQVGNTVDIHNAFSIGINQTPYNIAFGTLYFWIPFAVLTTAHVGGAQTINSVPRILSNLRRDITDLHEEDARQEERFRQEEEIRQEEERIREGDGAGQADGAGRDADEGPQRSISRGRSSTLGIRRVHFDSNSPAPRSETSRARLMPRSTEEFPRLRFRMKERWAQGGLPTWQPDKFDDFDDKPWFFMGALLSSFAIIAIPTACAMWISWRTPTKGFGCRTVTQLAFCASWLLNQGIDWLLYLCYKYTTYKKANMMV